MFCERIRKSYLLKIALLVLFVSYYGSTTSFWHVHTDGTTRTVHSHPYTSGNASHPGHSHTSCSYHLLHQFSHAQMLPATILSLSVAVFFLLAIISSQYSRPTVSISYRHRSLRAPPAIG